VAKFYEHQRLEHQKGVIVCSGYKTPGDINGDPWSPPGSIEQYAGVPEADSMRNLLLTCGIPDKSIRVERNSIDTVTNFLRVEEGDYFGDDRPVAIIAQRAHLLRIMEVVAEKTLRRDFIGVVVPEEGQADTDGFLPRAVSKAVLLGIMPKKPGAAQRAHHRAAAIWRIVNVLARLARRDKVYKTEADSSY
jgi:hypothetical protein